MNVCSQLSNYGKKKEMDAFQTFLMELKDRLLNLTNMQETFVMMEYIDNCRSVYRQNYEALRKLKLKGDQTAMQLILTNSCGSHVDTCRIDEDEDQDHHFGIPEEYLKVYSFEQIGLPKDLNMKAKIWRKVKAFMDKQFPQFFKKEQKFRLEKIRKYKSKDKTTDLCYIQCFNYIPCEQIMWMLVMKAALSN